MLNADLHGSVPDTCHTALLLIDVINPLDFPEADQLLRYALPAAEQLARSEARAKRRRIPVIYANDNFGRWRSDLAAVVDRCLLPDCKGKQLVELLHPDPDDYFVLKPKHSVFYSTALDTLLRYLGTRRLILGGFAGNICVLFTANDAYMRDFELFVPADCVASNTQEENDAALEQMARVLKCDVRPASAIDFPAMVSLRAHR